MCGKAVCNECSTTTRRLTRKDLTLHKICDDCDDRVSNYFIEEELKAMLNAKNTMLQDCKKKIEQASERIHEYQEDIKFAENKLLALDQGYIKAQEREKQERNIIERQIESTKEEKAALEEKINQDVLSISEYAKTLIKMKDKHKRTEDRCLKKEAILKKFENEFKECEKELEEQKHKLAVLSKI